MAHDDCPVPRFTHPTRTADLLAALPEVDALLRAHADSKRIPGMIWGVVIDATTVHVATAGVRDLASGAPIGRDTAFRIASLTKSLTALAVLKLRDEGRLSLEDDVSRWIPAFGSLPLPTRDTAPITVRQLLTNHAGFPEDNPWGDRQLDATEAQLDAWLAGGIPFSTPPGTRYEYSNYGWALLGRIIAAASGMPYRQYVEAHLLQPLGMTQSTFEPLDVPDERRAIGYRLTADGRHQEEPPLGHGVFGAMGGLVTTANDLGRYVGFHLSAWPARDDEDTGPVRRASVREMAHMANLATVSAGLQGDRVTTSVTGYGFGLRVTADCRFDRSVAHGGGLPGFGSYMAWLPEYGVGLFAMATLTYSGPHEAVSRAWDVLRATGALQRRELPVSAALADLRPELAALWDQWDYERIQRIAADNLLLDLPAREREWAVRSLKDEMGACMSVGPMRPENWLRGQVNLTCERGTVGVFVTLTPTIPPRVQHLAFRKLSTADERLSAPTGPPAGVTCNGSTAATPPAGDQPRP